MIILSVQPTETPTCPPPFPFATNFIELAAGPILTLNQPLLTVGLNLQKCMVDKPLKFAAVKAKVGMI